MKKYFLILLLLICNNIFLLSGEHTYIYIANYCVETYRSVSETFYFNKGEYNVFYEYCDGSSSSYYSSLTENITRQSPTTSRKWTDVSNLDQPSIGKFIADVAGYYKITFLHKKFDVIYPEFSGTCGDNLTWNFDTITNTLSIAGYGEMKSRPWKNISPAIKNISLPQGVTSICDSAFYGCSGLTCFTSLAETPPTLGANAFDGVSLFIPVHVACGELATYKSTDGWEAFSNFQEPFAKHSIVVNVNDDKKGTVKIDKNTLCGTQLSAIPNYGYYFVKWSDSYTDNPRTLVLTQDTTLTAEFAPNNYTISTQCNDSERGTTSGDVTTTYLDNVTISATANYGYHFTHWNDYNYDNPRQVQVTEDKSYTAYFDKNTYYITKNYDSNHGYVSGSTSGEYLDHIALTAEPNYGYHFVRWEDGNTDNPRHFILTQDTTFTAEFAQTFSGKCGNNLYWSFNDKTLTITGFGAMWNERPWGLFVNEIQNVVLPSGLTHIGDDAFTGCVGLSRIDIPYSVTSIGNNSFAGCRKLFDIYCYALTPPIAETTSFANYNVYLNVPCDNLRDYQMDMVFGSFKYIQCVGSEQVETKPDSVIISPSTNDVTITWPTDKNADTYSIEIKRGDAVFCILTFDQDGMLTNISFAPSRNSNHPATYAASTGNGLRFTVTSLDAGTTYGYKITTKDASEKTLATYSGEFTTKGNVSTEISDIHDPKSDIRKLIRDGQLIIIRDGKTYNAMGVEM